MELKSFLIAKNVLILTVLLTCIMLYANNKMKKSKFVPLPGKLILAVGQDCDTIDEFVEKTRIIPGGVMLYTSVNRAEGLEEETDFGSGRVHAQYLVEKYPYSVLQIGLYMVGILEEILAGQFDDNIDIIGEWIRKTKRPVYLRIGYEFDFPDNNYDPELYQKVFRYIADRYNKNKIDNIAYVWHSFAAHGRFPIMKWYPGDEYVDWFAVSFFQQNQTAMVDLIAREAKKHDKPLMIAEATPFGLGTDKGQESWDKWFKPCFKLIEKWDIKMLSYINTDWDSQSMWMGQGWGDARVQADHEVLNRWQAEVDQDKYLKASPELYQNLR